MKTRNQKHVRQCQYNELSLRNVTVQILPYANTSNKGLDAYSLWKLVVDKQRIQIITNVFDKYDPRVLTELEIKKQRQTLIDIMRRANIKSLKYNNKAFKEFIDACFSVDRSLLRNCIDLALRRIFSVESIIVDKLFAKYGKYYIRVCLV